MSKRKTRNISIFVSILAHVGLMFLFMAFRFTIEYDEDEFVEIGFGTFGQLSSSGAIGEKKEEVQTTSPPIVKKEEKKVEEKKVEVPKTVNTDETNKVVAAEDKKKDKKDAEDVKPIVKDEENSSQGREVTGEGVGKFGFQIDFGGQGKRKIYSYPLPQYPEGVSKEIDVKLRFTILPDGTVGRIIPLIKADTRLETAAINSLRQWRFEPLPESQKQAQQTAVIIFPFRLR